MTFKRVLLNTCQEEFEGTAEARQGLKNLPAEDREVGSGLPGQGCCFLGSTSSRKHGRYSAGILLTLAELFHMGLFESQEERQLKRARFRDLSSFWNSVGSNASLLGWTW